MRHRPPREGPCCRPGRPVCRYHAKDSPVCSKPFAGAKEHPLLSARKATPLRGAMLFLTNRGEQLYLGSVSVPLRGYVVSWRYRTKSKGCRGFRPLAGICCFLDDREVYEDVQEFPSPCGDMLFRQKVINSKGKARPKIMLFADLCHYYSKCSRFMQGNTAGKPRIPGAKGPAADLLGDKFWRGSHRRVTGRRLCAPPAGG